jgi:hypothetical protein|tara:strand:+ start:205 stop:327 length:123 start_codon:yes stop_codon:yes gene_type:complete
MAIITISTHDDEEAAHIHNILEQLDFPLQGVDIKYDDDLK